jgi:DNA-binding response OmpR family regulator
VRDCPVQLDPACRAAIAGTRRAILNRREYAILETLREANGEVVPHAVLLSRAWGPHTPLANLRVAILHLRRKLEADPELPSLIVAAPGAGYRLGRP